MSYADQAFSFGDSGLILIDGPNGVGKSTVWDAISWCIFGKTVRGAGSDDVINRFVGSNCSVVLNTEHRKTKYTIKRYRKDDKFGDRLIVEKGKETVELGTLAMTQQWILDEFGIDFDLFCCTILFAQEQTFNFVSASNKAQKEILSKVMKISYDDFLDRAKAKIKELGVMRDTLNEKITVLQSHKVEDPELLYEREIAEWKASRKAKIAEAEAKLVSEIQAVERVKADLGKFEKVKSIRDKIDSAMREIDRKSSKLREASGKLEGRIESLQAQIDRLATLKAECPTCFQAVKGEILRERKTELEEKVSEAHSEKSKIEKIIGKCKKKHSFLYEKLDYADDRILLFKDTDSNYNRALQRVEDLKTEVQKVREEKNPYSRLVEEAIEKQRKITKKLEALNNDLKEIENKSPYYQFWVGAFGDTGIKSFVFDLVCSTLTSRANHYLNILTDGKVTISFDTQKTLKSGETREKFDCIIHTNGQRVPYCMYSGGEKRRVSLAVDMSLSDLMSDYYDAGFNVVVFDEQTNFLDEKGRRCFINLVKDISKRKQVFVVDHDAQMKSEFDDVWSIQKAGGLSCLQEN